LTGLNASGTLQKIYRATHSQVFMKSAPNFSIALVIAPDLKTARALAKAALSARLIACANLVPKIESHYWWQGKVESSAEVLLVLKTTKARLAALEKMILSKHPYDTPEFLVLPLRAGNRKYLDWLAASCR
jgi:periplasmic divalent cation tolerance protein